MKGESGQVRLFIALFPFSMYECKFQNLKTHYHFKAQSIIPTCQGIEEIGRDEDLDRHVTVTLPSPC
jgi:hypothetical protein